MKDSRAPPDPPGRVRTEGGESGDSEIEEVGRAYRHSSSREQGLASSSFDWGASSFTSTLDVDAIKVSESSGPTKAPLTTIAPDWEEAVLPPMPNLAAERTLPKLEPAVDSSSESESEGCSASDSESGSNEGSSSSSCSSLESDSSSENEEDSSKVDPPRLTRKARSSSRSRAPRTSSRAARASPTSRAARASPSSSRNQRESPTSMSNRLTSNASPAPRFSPISSRAVRSSPVSHQQLPSLPSQSSSLPSQSSCKLPVSQSSCSATSPPRLSASSSSRRSRQGSGSSRRHSSILLLKKSSLLCQKSDYGEKPEDLSSPERNPSGDQEEDDTYLKSCKIAEIFHKPNHTSPLPRISDKTKKRSSNPILTSEEPSRENVSPMDSAEEMPQLFDFSEEPVMPVLDNPATELNRAISSIRPERMDDLDLADIITDLANSNDSDDSCMIVEPPCIVAEEKLSPPKPDTDDMKYNHKRNMIFGIYGKSQDKNSHKMVKETKSIFDMEESEGSIAGKGSSDDSSGSESESGESTTSSSSCSELASPPLQLDLESQGEKKPNLQQCSNPPTSVESSDSSDSESSSSGPGTPPPTLAPEVLDSPPPPSPSPHHREMKPLKRQDRPKSSKSKRKVEMACQTDFSPSHHISGAATPPRLIGFGMEPSKLNRGRPRKNPPMLEPEICSLGVLKKEEKEEEEEEEDQPALEDYSSQGSKKKKKKKKGKLSVLFAAAKHWQKQQEKSQSRKVEQNVYDFEEEEAEGASEEVNDEVCDKRRHSKTAKTKTLKVRSKHKDNGHRRRRESHKAKNIHSHHLSERKRAKKQKKVVISSEDEEEEAEVDEVEGKRNGKSGERASGVAKDDCTQCHTVPGLANKQEPVSDEEAARSQKQTESAKKTVVKKERKTIDAVQPVFELFGTSNNFADIGSTPGLIFSKKFCNLKPDTFWKEGDSGGLKLLEEPSLKSEVLSTSGTQQESKGSTFTTKASVKEMPSNGSSQSFPPAFVPKNQVQQMASLLASLDSLEKVEIIVAFVIIINIIVIVISIMVMIVNIIVIVIVINIDVIICQYPDCLEKVTSKKSRKEGRKHSKREKEAKKNSEDSVMRRAYETCYETQSEDEEGGGGKKKKKGWKSKHKNVIDPVFLGELEHLIQDISCCQLELKLPTDLWPERPSDCVPSIFRRRRIQTPTKTRRKDSSGKVTKRAKAGKQGSQQQQAEVAILDLTESDEQRLPLKKRHHIHLQGDGKEGKEEVGKRMVGTLQVKSPEKICREFRISNKARAEETNRQTNKVRAEESGESCLSPSKMTSQSEMRGQAGLGSKNIQEKLNKKPTAADRIVEKLGMQIKKESLEVINEPKSGRPGKVSDRSSRRISKEAEITRTDLSAPRNTQQSSFPPPPLVKQESKSKSFTESTFVDSIQDCIEKYTNASPVPTEKAKLQHGTSSLEPLNQNLVPKLPQKQSKAQGGSDVPEIGFVTLFSSPEHEVNIASGRNSSMSQSSTSSDSCSIINVDADQETKKSRLGRASSRQDLHSHLWKQDEPAVTPSSSSSASSPSGTVTSKAAAYRSLVSETMRKRGLDPTSRPQMSSTKPLPTEPIRRVDLVQGYCHKPLDKSGRPLSGQECLIRKVPQAIVAPFRRNPPEQPAPVPVVPIHRASIASHTSSTSTAAEALLSATTSLTASLPPISAPVQPANPTSPVPAASVQTSPKESPSSPAVSCKDRAEESKAKEKDEEKEDLAVSLPELPKTRSKLELEAKLENRKKEARIKRCKVAVERLDEKISRRALLGVSSLEKKVADLKVTETERRNRRRGSVETERSVLERERITRRQVLAENEVEKRVASLHVSDTERPQRQERVATESDCKEDNTELCVTKQLEELERNRKSLAGSSKSLVGSSKSLVGSSKSLLGCSGPLEEIPNDGEKMDTSLAEPPPADEKKENGGETDAPGHKLGKISDKPELAKSSPVLLGTGTRGEGQEDKLEKQSEVLRKRRRKTNKTGFPTTLKKKRRVEKEKTAQQQQWVEKVSSEGSSGSGRLQLSISGTSRGGESQGPDQVGVRSEVAETRQTSTGRPLRECREKAEERPPEEKENTESGTRGRKRLGDLGSRGRGRPPKRLKGVKLARRSFRPSNSSSFDPSPASSDVESIDYKSFLDDESDVDSLSALPSSEDNFLSPSVAQSSESHQEDRKRKVKQSNLLRKNFLKAGLFSYDFKRVNAAAKETQDCPGRGKGLMYRPEEHPFGLLPPPYYCGRQLRQKKEDFNLPHDIWHLHATDSLPARDIVASWNYKKIKNNIYSTDGRYMQSFETPNCHCKVPQSEEEMGCTDKCLNRMTYTECDPDSCHLKNRCSNQSIQKHLSTTVLRRFMTPHKGWGVKTKCKIKKDTFIMEYLGEVVTDKEFKQRMHTDYKQDNHHYCLHVGEGMVIDGHRMGGECRFVNHSCKPNCEMQKWSVNGMYRMALFSSREIQSDEELTYDYNFSLFNPHEGQTCHCGNEECRGVIGGKGRKNATKTPTKPAKVKEKKTEEGKKEGRVASEKIEETKVKTEELRSHFAPMKPMSGTQKTFCRTHSVLLLRNLEKIRRLRELYLNRGPTLANLRGQGQRTSEKQKKNESQPQQQQGSASNYSEEVFKAGLAALTTMRSVTTRRLASAQDNPDVSKVVQIARKFQQILTDGLQNVKTEDGCIVRSNFDNVPSKEDLPGYHLKISEPIDFGIIEKNLSSGSYHSVAHVDQDILLLFQNNLRFYGCLSTQGKQAMMLREKYMEMCEEEKASLAEIVGPEGVRCLSRPAIPKTEDEEDIIRCPCNQFKDEGVMVQCDACQCWQHTDCVAVNVDPSKLEEFTCKVCSGEKPNLDIPLVPQPEHASPGELHYVSMAREDNLHVTLGMTVYVLRAFKERHSDGDSKDGNGTSPDKITIGPGGIPHKAISPIKGPSKQAASLHSGQYPTYQTIDPTLVNSNDMDIFRVERLWVNEAGHKFAFGFHYLRPHETFHEPSRRFFDNEVFRVPIYEVLPLDTIWAECWVTDPVTFCRGRALAAKEEDVYICEYRVDKTARLFNKISKAKYPTCTKSYAFHNFDLRLKVTRSYTPHEVPDKFKSWRERDPARESLGSNNRDETSGREVMTKSRDQTPEGLDLKSRGNRAKQRPAPLQRDMNKVRRGRPLESVLQILLSAQSDSNPEDASGLLDNLTRKRKRVTAGYPLAAT